MKIAWDSDASALPPTNRIIHIIGFFFHESEMKQWASLSLYCHDMSLWFSAIAMRLHVLSPGLKYYTTLAMHTKARTVIDDQPLRLQFHKMKHIDRV